MNWIEIIKDDIDTYPKEGIDVLISDGKNYDVAYYIMSSSYKWLKVDLIEDTANEFTSFIISKWAYIE